jgi:hypothetical protein
MPQKVVMGALILAPRPMKERIVLHAPDASETGLLMAVVVRERGVARKPVDIERLPRSADANREGVASWQGKGGFWRVFWKMHSACGPGFPNS